MPNEYSTRIILKNSDFILTNRTCAIAITADMSFKTALAADFSGVTDTGKVLMLLGDEGDGEAARGPGKSSLALDEIERLPRGKGSEGAFTSSVRSEPWTTASTGVVCADTLNLLRD